MTQALTDYYRLFYLPTQITQINSFPERLSRFGKLCWMVRNFSARQIAAEFRLGRTWADKFSAFLMLQRNLWNASANFRSRSLALHNAAQFKQKCSLAPSEDKWECREKTTINMPTWGDQLKISLDNFTTTSWTPQIFISPVYGW